MCLQVEVKGETLDRRIERREWGETHHWKDCLLLLHTGRSSSWFSSRQQEHRSSWRAHILTWASQPADPTTVGHRETWRNAGDSDGSSSGRNTEIHFPEKQEISKILKRQAIEGVWLLHSLLNDKFTHGYHDRYYQDEVHNDVYKAWWHVLQVTV